MGNAIKRSINGPSARGLLAIYLLAASNALALEGQSTLTPAKVKEIQKTNQSYKECTTAATGDVKSGKMKAQDLPAAFERCRDKYPGAGLFIECKKNLLKSSKVAEIDVAEVAQCKKFLTAANFDPADAVPVFINRTQSFFAGIGMNLERKVADMELPNFTCERFQASLSNIPKNAQHILFGNHPKMFLSGPEQEKFVRALAAATGKPAKGEKFSDVDGFGRVFGDPLSAQSIIYFPSSSCDFRGVLGSTFTGLSMFYLADAKGRSATPYFGISYYRSGQKSVTTPELVAEVTRRLGRDFKAYSKDAQTIFISSTPFQEVDQERDPRNICKAPRPHQFVAIIHTSKADPNSPEYLILANIRNLCDYGDRLAKKLVR